MKRALLVVSLGVLFLLSSELGAQLLVRSPDLTDQRAEEVPLRNWGVSFEDILSSEKLSAIEAMALPSAASHFIAIVPCRLVDTRNAPGTYGGPAFVPSLTRIFNVPGGPCPGIPVAAAYSLNFTIVNYDASNGFITAYPSGRDRPFVSTVNFGNGTNAVANAALVPASDTGSIDVFSSGATNLIIDINGYFVEGVVTRLTEGSAIDVSAPTGDVTVSIQPDGVTSAHLATNSVGAEEIAADAVGASEIATNAVNNSEIATDAVGSFEIVSNAVTADEIAAGAVDISELATQRSVLFGASVGESNVTVLNFGGLVLTANCNAGPDIELIATTTTNDGAIASSIGDDNNDFDVGESADIMSGTDNNVVGSLVYRNRGVFTVTVHWHAFENTPAFNCLVAGIATRH